MIKVGKLLPTGKKPSLRIPEMNHPLGKSNRADIASKFSECLPVLLYPLILGLLQSAIGNKGPDELQLTSVKPSAMALTLVNDYPGYFGKVLPVHEASASDARNVLNRIAYGPSNEFLWCLLALVNITLPGQISQFTPIQPHPPTLGTYVQIAVSIYIMVQVNLAPGTGGLSFLCWR